MPRAGLVPVPLPPANYTETHDLEVKSEEKSMEIEVKPEWGSNGYK